MTILTALPLQLTPTMITIVAAMTLGFLAVLAVCIISWRQTREKRKELSYAGDILMHAITMGGISVLRVKTDKDKVSNIYGEMVPQEGMTGKEYLERVHPDDRQNVEQFLNRLSMRQTTANVLHYCWNAAPTGEPPCWRNLRNSAIAEGDKTPLDIVCTLTDETDSVMERQQEHDLALRYQSIFDRSIVGMSIYDKEGMLLASNSNMRQFMNMGSAYDKMYFGESVFTRAPFRDIMDKNMKTDLYFCTKLVIPERNVNSYHELLVHPVLDEQGETQFFCMTGRDITTERDLYLQERDNNEAMRKMNEEIQNYETELQYMMEKCDMRVWRMDFKQREVTFYKGLSNYEQKISLNTFKDYFLGDTVTAQHFDAPEAYFAKPSSSLCHMRPVFHQKNATEWNMVDFVPINDEAGTPIGCFGTIRNASSLIHAQEKLKEETRRANDSARLKSIFMANMTHEIRTPLNAIVGFSDLLPMMQTPAEKKELLQVIMSNCDMLVRLINDILEISSMDGSAIIVNPEEVDFAKVFDEQCLSLAKRIQQPGVEFIKDNPYTTLTLSIDQRRVRQVITNFVINAIKYTQQGHIKAGYRIEQPDGTTNHLYIYCEDTGVGIPKDKQATVFDRFVKLNDYVQGTGLGLSICKAIATRCGGEIGVESEGEGHGSTFWLRLPVTLINEERP